MNKTICNAFFDVTFDCFMGMRWYFEAYLQILQNGAMNVYFFRVFNVTIIQLPIALIITIYYNTLFYFY